MENEVFIEKSKEIHGNKYDYSLVKYVNQKSKVKIICPEHGIFEATPTNHIHSGTNCPKCGAIKSAKFKINKARENFKEKSIIIHGDKYDYSLVDYINNFTKVKIVCPEHGIFEQKPNSHLNGRGCLKCGKQKQIYTKINNCRLKFKEKARIVHNNKYDYSLVEYKSATDVVKIICPEHGEFEQIPHSHLKGSGCQECVERQNIHNMIWFYSNDSKGQEQGLLYLLKFSNDKELFYKVGITSNSIKQRYRNKNYKVYNIEVLKIVEDSNLNCAIFERSLHKLNENIRYKPLNKFDGWTECFSQIPMGFGLNNGY